ncbi:MAG: beta-galactosidase trimerization domain-containing protein [Candidatus Omnitrophica bacterium]|nr:beta-galactosidase trimerization domain-containing protein [Candidatus Omnitrophota bacterium]
MLAIRGMMGFFCLSILLFSCLSVHSGTLDNLIVIEAENCVDDFGTPITGPKGTTSNTVFFVSNPSASGNGFISSYPSPFRVYQNLSKPAIAKTEVDIPVSGKWYIHVRYLVTPENIRKLLSSQKPPGHFRYFAPFKVIIGKNEFSCGADQSPGEEFRWDTFETNLSAGKIPVMFVMENLSGPDCIVLTKTPDYKPMPSDYEGPLWFRFKISKAPADRFYIFCRLYFNPYEVKGPVNLAWLFKDKVATTSEESNELQKDGSNFLTTNQWSPWVKTVNPKRAYCSMHTMFMPSNMKLFPDARRTGLNNLEITFQAATRPDEDFIIHQATEFTGPVRGMYILMPHEPGLAGMKKWTKSFSQWAEERLNLVKQTGAKPGEGPKKIQVFTDARATVYKDIEAIIESCKLAGFNGFDLAQDIITETDLWNKIKDAGFGWTVAHHLMLVNPDYKEVEKKITGEKSIQETLNQYFYELIKQRVEKLWGSRSETRRQMLDLAILADEPNPQPHFLMINFVPVLKACFHQFLKSNGLTPQFFGRKNWEEVEAIGIATRASPTIENILRNFGVEIEWVQNTGAKQEDEEVSRATQIEQGSTGEKKQEKIEGLRRVKVQVRADLKNATLEEKRLYYWTQRFRSYFTMQIYGTGANVVKELADKGFFKKDIKISPNFQAAPMMETRMWDGALNLFEWAENNTTNFLLCEDWINDPYRVAFGFSLLNAAARKNNQELGYLIVVDRNFRRRYLAGLAQGVKLFIDYSYGPTITKGPAWAASPEYTKDWCEMLRWTARCEDDIVGTKMRKSDVALLIANSSEIGSAFYSATNFETELSGRAFGSRPMFRRAGIYTALLDAGIPVEIVSEEEILEKGLDRYRVLYVVDTHVKEDVQRKIREWVQKGGTLWADYIAIARNEYDQDTSIMNEVFGLTSRGLLPGVKNSPEPVARTITVLNSDGLEPVKFIGSLFKPDWQLSTGRPLAVFEDGSPAIVYNRFGNGQAILVGCSALTFSPYSNQCINNPEFDKIRKVVSYTAEISGIRRHCEINISGVNAFVRDGERQTVLFLINSTGKRQNIQVKLQVSGSITSAFDARGYKIQFGQKGSEIIFNREINENDGDICVFRW